ncbi:MAG: peptide-methionine (S)-S-oxide reductase MsrA [Ferruginibacter sp.]|nr:peptide-methionine (S)-S-oxide reductase MsrA [Ferruginibacter sp.]
MKNLFIKSKVITIFILLFVFGCNAKQSSTNNNKLMQVQNETNTQISNIDTATLGGGCFWCVEAQLQQLKGVLAVQSGYAGGILKNPTYKEVGTGETGHAEVIQVIFDNNIITYDEILAAFWHAHDPTQLNKQGNDVGTQYRSVIFYNSQKQKLIAEDYKKKINEEHVYDNDIVTEISPLTVFYKAEDYHQNYYNQNKSQGYCQFVIAPKLEKFNKIFKDKLKQ